MTKPDTRCDNCNRPGFCGSICKTCDWFFWCGHCHGDDMDPHKHPRKKNAQKPGRKP